MHELLLFGQVPAARHGQLLNVMAGLAAMQPERAMERHVVWKPTRGPVQVDVLRGGGVRQDAQVLKTKKVGQMNQQIGELYYVRLIRALEEEEFGVEKDGDVDMDGEDALKEGGKSNWRLRFEDVPEPGKMTALLRMVEDIEFAEGDAQAYMETLGYKQTSEYVVEGHRVVHNNIILFLHRLLTQHGKALGPLNAPLAPFSEYTPLDPANSYVLQATVRLADGGNPKVLSLASEELDVFRRTMAGVIHMDAPDRLSLDTRIK